MAFIEIINSGALSDALQTLPRDLPVFIEGEGVHGPYLIRKVEIREYYRGGREDKTLLVDPATTSQDGREIIRVLRLV